MGGVLHAVTRLTVATAFLIAGVIKLWRPEVFAVTIKAFGILPDAFIPPLSVILPCLEIAAALLLLFNVRGGLSLTAGLLALFVIILLYALSMGLDVDCGCYGPSDPELEAFSSIRRALWRDFAMLAGVAYLSWGKGRQPHTAHMPGASARADKP